MSNLQTSKKELKKFGITMAIGILLVFGIVLPIIFNIGITSVPFAIAAFIFAWSFIHTSSLIVIYKPWMWIGHILGFINTRIILSLVFFIVFTPMAIIRRLFFNDSMQRKIDPNIKSYWQESMNQGKEHMERSY